MSFFKNTASLLAIMCVIPAAHAATARPSVLATATGVSASGSVRRLPTMTAVIKNSATTTSTSTGSTLLNNSECIDAYSACIKGADACGQNFEECTNKVLFHAQMPECLSTLAQCSASGITDLFGTSTVSALASGATTNSYGEVTDYMYPLDGSVMGQMINAAAIANKYDTQTCVKRYSSCLRKDSVCGEDFELCTTPNEFKKQAVFCASTLARCQSAGLTELFGSATANATPTATSRIGMMIEEGAALAAVNAVSTCYKVADQCMLNACAENPYMCFESATASEQAIAKSVVAGTVPETGDMIDVSPSQKSAVRKHIRGYCAETIGTNKYCFATFLTNGLMPSSSQLLDEDNQESVFDMAYDARMNSAMKSKVQDMINDFDERAKSKCVATFKSCAMRSCGDGSGAACYSLVFGHQTDKSINNENAYAQIKNGCAAIVNTDANCVYAAQHANAAGLYNYQFSKQDAFATLFPEYDGGAESDPLSIVAELNATLSSSYNEAAVAQMRKQCQSVATGCVKSMCGTDYENCYRRRSDIFSSLTNTNDAAFNKSMNKVNGVLDYTIILGMCVDTVKNSDACTEHLAIEAAKLKISNEMDKSVWGGSSSARGAWIDAGAGIHMESVTEETDVQQTDDQGNKLCTDNCGSIGVCGSMSTKECGAHDTPAMISYTSYVQSQAANSLFKDLIYDLEFEAQAAYNAKLTYQMNQCMNENATGGIVGNRDMGGSYAWVKLRGNKIPDDYNVNGIQSGQMVASNDLYNSFCRVRVTLQSSDKAIQDALTGTNSTAYFAVGDGFTCGSWLSTDVLTTLANAAAKDAVKDMEKRQKSTRIITTILGGIATTTGGGFLGQKLAEDGLDDWNSNRKEKLADKVDDDIDIVINFDRWKEKDANNVLDILKESKKASYIDGCDKGELKALLEIALKSESEVTIDDDTHSDCMYLKKLDDSLKCEAIATEEDANKKRAELIKKAQTLAADEAKKCERKDDAEVEEDKKNNNGWTKGGGATLGAVGLGVVGTGAIYHITKAAQEAKLTEAEQEAYNEFMESVGSKIRCVVGHEEIASFGQFVPMYNE